MTKQRDLKKLVRARMAKTGESYTAARANLVGRPAAPLPPGYEALAGFTDAVMQEKTGKTWPEWVRLLDDEGATEWEHRDMAAWAGSQVGLWWAQTVAVGYERLRGLRLVGQTCNGDFAASKSATVAASRERIRRAFGEERTSWLVAPLTPRTTTSPSSLRFDGHDGALISIWLTPKSPEKCTVAVQITKLSGPESRDAAKSEWASHLAALKEWVG